MTTVPDTKTAALVAQRLLDDRVAACVQTLSPCTSTYRWKGQIETAQEFPVLVKCAASRAQEAMQAIKDMHPYEVPEIIAIPIQGGLKEYLAWIQEQCAPTS